MHTLRAGAMGCAVETLQDLLRQLGFYSGVTTGVYDLGTARAVMSVQKVVHAKPTGIADEQTLLYIVSKAAVVPADRFSEQL